MSELQDLRKVLAVGDIVTFGRDPEKYKVITVGKERADFMPLIWKNWKKMTDKINVRIA